MKVASRGCAPCTATPCFRKPYAPSSKEEQIDLVASRESAQRCSAVAEAALCTQHLQAHLMLLNAAHLMALCASGLQASAPQPQPGRPQKANGLCTPPQLQPSYQRWLRSSSAFMSLALEADHLNLRGQDQGGQQPGIVGGLAYKPPDCCRNSSAW